jgi:signal transduction histidine kinase
MESKHHAGPAPQDDLAAQVFREQLRLAFELLPVAILANTVLTLAVFAVLVQVASPTEIILWTVVMLALIAVRAAAVWSYRRTPEEARDNRLYARWYFIPYACTGLGWAILAAFLVPDHREVYAVLAMCAVYGLAAGGVAFLGHMRDLYGVYLLATLLPAAAKWLATWWQFGGDFRLVMGITTLVFIGLLYSASHQLSKLVTSAVAARLEKEALARRLQELVATVERANQAKSDFIARMSRQVYAPTEAIVGQARELLGAPGAAPDALRRETLQGLHDGAQSLLGMLGDVLDYSSLEAGQLDIERVEFDLRELLTSTAAAGEREARVHGLAFALEVTDAAPRRVLGDPRRLAQILANLLANAVRFTPSGSIGLEVKSVNVEGPRHTLAFAVRDTGVGIAPQRLGEIFQPFVGSQAGGQASAQAGAQGHAGSGLGLAICRRLAGLMQGALAVQSEPGGGSVFTLMLAFTSVDA